MIRIFQQYVSLRTALLAVVECVFIALGLLLGSRIWFSSSQVAYEAYVSAPTFIVQLAVVAAVFQTCFFLNDLYHFTTCCRPARHATKLAEAIGVSFSTLGITCLLVPDRFIVRGAFFAGLLTVAVMVVLPRVVLALPWMSKSSCNAAILGTGHLASTVAAVIGHRPDLGFCMTGFISDDVLGDLFRDSCAPILGSVGELEAIVARHNIHWIIIAGENRRGMLPIRSLGALKVSGVIVEDAEIMLSRLTGRVWLEMARPSWFAYSEEFQRSQTAAFFKRTSDILMSLAGLILSLPLMAMVALAIRLDSKGPILYRQTRVGFGGRRFELLKFRSMHCDAEDRCGPQWSVINDPRVTRVGAVLRRFRLDEIPQFINILRGEMSLVGPRPERPFFTEQLCGRIAFYDERHSVRPGVTGWAQVRYRYGATFEDAARKLEYDLFYLKNMSFLFDLAIILQTVKTVMFGHPWMEGTESLANLPAAPATIGAMNTSAAAAGAGHAFQNRSREVVAPNS
jgi:sugar transferase (PEP-CTERM system associated)